MLGAPVACVASEAPSNASSDAGGPFLDGVDTIQDVLLCLRASVAAAPIGIGSERIPQVLANGLLQAYRSVVRFVYAALL